MQICFAPVSCAASSSFFGQNVRDAELEAGGHIGHVHTFSFHLRFVHKIEHSCFQTGEADVVRALYMGRGQGISFGIARLGGPAHRRAAGIGQTQRAATLSKASPAASSTVWPRMW